MRDITTNRYSVNASLSRSDFLGYGTTLGTGLGLEQYSYDTGDQRYRFVESAKLDTSLWGFFRNNVTWGRARVDGNTPFVFESLGSQHNYIKDAISLYYMSYLTWNISGGYNYMNSTYNDVLTNMEIRPSDQLMINTSTGWSIENQRYLDWVTGVTFVPYPKFTNTASITYDMNYGRLLSANSEVDLEYGDTWQERFHFKMRHFYDFYTDTYMLQDIAITKDLHCWEAYLSWSQYLSELRFGMTLKAFPEYPFSYITSPAGNYFNSFMDNMHFPVMSSPRRD
jgi:hypothetical protein